MKEKTILGAFFAFVCLLMCVVLLVAMCKTCDVLYACLAIFPLAGMIVSAMYAIEDRPVADKIADFFAGEEDDDE